MIYYRGEGVKNAQNLWRTPNLVGCRPRWLNAEAVTSVTYLGAIIDQK